MLSVSNISRKFGGLAALSEICVGVGRGEVVSVIGPNGAGKSTLFNVITGYIRPSNGSVQFAGRDITGLRPYEIANRGIGRSFQHSRLFPRLTVTEHLRVSGGRNLDKESTSKIIEMCGLKGKGNLFPPQISYEEQRKLEIARVLAGKPTLILLDEPAAGLNSQETMRLMQLILQIRDMGCSVTVIEHNMGFVMEISDRVVVLNFGRKIAEGTPAAVQEDQAVREAYIGVEA